MLPLSRALKSTAFGQLNSAGSLHQRALFHSLSSRNSSALSPKQMKIFREEYSAMMGMLNRSSSALLSNEYILRNLHTGNRLQEKQKENDAKKNDENKSDESEKKKSEDENDDLAKKNAEQSERNKKESRKKKQQPDLMLSLFTKGVLWTTFLYSFGIAFFIIMSLFTSQAPSGMMQEVSWQEFVNHMLIAGEVKQIFVYPDLEQVVVQLHTGSIVKGRRVLYPYVMLSVANANKVEEKIRNIERKIGIKDAISITYNRSSGEFAKIIFWLIAAAIIFSIIKNAKVDFTMDMGRRAKFTLINPKGGGKGVYFKDVVGMTEAKQEVIEFVDYLKKPEKYESLGARVPKGALLLGPPGCGKTLLAKAVATEAGVPFLTMNGSEFIEKIGGLGASRVRSLFSEAKKRAPCIIYIDEIDAIGKQRPKSNIPTSGESEQTLNQLLVEMDGMASKKGVLMLASTNRADVLDKALLRPGRFDRHILIDVPTLQERKEIFEKYLAAIKLDDAPAKYSNRLAVLTPGFSGADIANVCNEAALHAARTNKKVIEANDLEYAVERTVGGTEKRSHAMSDEERRTVAYHEAGHALVGWLLENSDVLQKVTIVPRTNLALGFAQYTPSEQKLFSKEFLLDKICMALGGRAAENITFERITTGAQNDLEKVTKIAHAMVAKYGMSERIGPMYVPDEQQDNYSGEKPYSNSLDNIIDVECRQLIQSAYFKAEKILKTNNDKLKKLAEELLKNESLNYEQVVELIGPPKNEAAKKKIDSVEFEQSLNDLTSKADEKP